MEETEMNRPRQNAALPVITGLVCGAVSGGLARTTIAPLERTKIIFQTSELRFSVKEAAHILNTTYRNDGVTGLWRGNGAEMIRILPYAAIQFMSHEYYKNLLLKKEESHLPPFRRFLAGSMAGATAVSMTYPLDLARARLAIQRGGNEKYFNLSHAFREIVKEGGVRGLFRGLPATLLGVMPYAGISFFTFETLKLQVLRFRQESELQLSERMVCGAIAGATGQSATYPLDIVRRRMQTDGFLNDRRPLGIIATFISVAKTQGIRRGLYKGLSMNWFKGPIAVSIAFSTFDTLKSVMHREFGIDISLRHQ